MSRSRDIVRSYTWAALFFALAVVEFFMIMVLYHAYTDLSERKPVVLVRPETTDQCTTVSFPVEQKCPTIFGLQEDGTWKTLVVTEETCEIHHFETWECPTPMMGPPLLHVPDFEFFPESESELDAGERT